MLTVDDYKNGQVILIDKPLNWTSFQVVNKIRWHIKRKFGLKKIKVGHAGTLDPLATGLLILCTGKFTKKIETFQAQTKAYEGTLVLGATTPSFDLETEIDKHFPINHITNELILKTVGKFTGEISQIPPIYSAIKKDGKKLYDLARAGKTTEIKSRSIVIHSFNITKIEKNNVYFTVVCSKGTYIRSLAHDFGKALNSGAYLAALRRTQIGDFNVENAYSIDAYLKQNYLI
ncbi:MAG: tRNA pseudouridine(55) synthase TruB [Lutibacter sp.]